MKLLISFLAIIAAFSSCNRSDKAGKEDDASRHEPSPASKESQHLCFQRLEGAALRDTTVISLSITGSLVSGKMNHIPFEKDSRKGTLKGEMKDHRIVAVWSFVQEGQQDTLPVELKLQDKYLLQRAWGIDKESGRQAFTDTSRFSLRFEEVDCSKINKPGF